MALRFAQDKKSGMLTDVAVCYVKMQEGSLKYQSKMREFSVDAVVPHSVARKFKKAFPKNSCTEIENQDFEAKYKIEPVFDNGEDEDGESFQYVLKLRVDAQITKDMKSKGLSKGDDVPYEWNIRPKVYIPVHLAREVLGEDQEDWDAFDQNAPYDATMLTTVGNGSICDIAFNVTENAYGHFPKLTGILVKEFEEYEGSGSSASPFGAVAGGLNPGDGNHEQRASEEEPEEDEDEDDTPFGKSAGGVDEEEIPERPRKSTRKAKAKPEPEEEEDDEQEPEEQPKKAKRKAPAKKKPQPEPEPEQSGMDFDDDEDDDDLPW